MGSGGVMMGLPLLEGLLPKTAQADPLSAVPAFALFYRKPNGVAQHGRQLLRGCGEHFWPELASGAALTDANCPDPSSRGTGELSNKYWKRSTLIKGLAHPFIDWGHMSGIVQMFTGARVEPRIMSYDPEGRDGFFVRGESLDNRIARELGGRSSSLALGLQPRSENNTGSFLSTTNSFGSCTNLQASSDFRTHFDRLFSGVNTDAAAFERLRAQKKSVNDLLRARLKRLRDSKRLSKNDKERLDLHTSNIRDLEKLLCDPSQGDLRSVADQFENDAGQNYNSQDACYSMRRRGADIAGRLAALAISCGVTRSVLVNAIHHTGDMMHYNDEWPDEWQGLGDMHESVSHGDLSNPKLAKAHQCVDRAHLRMFRSLLDKLDEYQVGSGTLVDAGVSLFASDIGQGCHTLSDVPYLYVGSAAGKLKTGLYLDMFKGTESEARSGSRDDTSLRMRHFEPPVKLLNTIGAAVGCKNASGSGPLDDFNADNNGGIRGRMDMLVAG